MAANVPYPGPKKMPARAIPHDGSNLGSGRGRLSLLGLLVTLLLFGGLLVVLALIF